VLNQRLYIRAHVFAGAVFPGPLVLEPGMVQLNNLAGESSVQVTMRNTSADTLQARLICGPSDLFDIVVPETAVNPNQSENITLTFDQRITDEVFTKSFTIEVDDSFATRYTVPVTKSVAADPPGARIAVANEDCEVFGR